MLRQYIFAFEKGNEGLERLNHLLHQLPNWTVKAQRHNPRQPDQVSTKLDQGKGGIWWHPCLSRSWHTDHSRSRFRELIIVTEVYKSLSRCIIFIQQTHSLIMLCVCAHVYLSVCRSVCLCLCETFLLLFVCFVLLGDDHRYTEDHLGCHCPEATHLILEGSLTNMELADSSRLAAQRTPKFLLSLSS